MGQEAEWDPELVSAYKDSIKKVLGLNPTAVTNTKNKIN
jgi:hypothetical protein